MKTSQHKKPRTFSNYVKRIQNKKAMEFFNIYKKNLESSTFFCSVYFATGLVPVTR